MFERKQILPISGDQFYLMLILNLIWLTFQTVYNRVARGMLHEDKITYAIILARIFLRGQSKLAFCCCFSF